jgi:dienelactone hydrolase
MNRAIGYITVFALCFFIAGLSDAVSEVSGRQVEYRGDNILMKGYLASNGQVRGKRPGVLVVHEWWGLNEYARKRANMLAELGYVALAVDMYGEGKQAEHPDDASKFSSELMKNFDGAKARFLAALNFLRSQPDVDPDQIAAIGYCFGGGVVLNMARQGVDLKAVASFHGSLAAVKPAEPGSVKAKLIVFHGADDTFVPAEQIEAFKKEMTSAGADFRFISYPGAIHSFTNPDADAYAKKFNMKVGYNKEADRKSWDELRKFLGEALKK